MSNPKTIRIPLHPRQRGRRLIVVQDIRRPSPADRAPTIPDWYKAALDAWMGHLQAEHLKHSEPHATTAGHPDGGQPGAWATWWGGAQCPAGMTLDRTDAP